MRRRWLTTPRAVLLGALALIGALWFFQPRHLVLDIPVRRHLGGGDFWWETKYAALAYADEWGVLYLHRQVGTAYPEPHGWRTVDEAFAYFDGWLRERGWKLGGASRSDPALPESRLLPVSNHRRYFRDGGETRVLVAIWPIGGTVEGFHVVIVSARPSWLRLLSDGLD